MFVFVGQFARKPCFERFFAIFYMCMFFQHSETEFGHFNTQFGSDLHEFQKKWKLNIFQFFGQYSARLEYLEKKADLVDLSF